MLDPSVRTAWAGSGNSVLIQLTEISGAFTLRDYTAHDLSANVDQKRFMKAAKIRAIRALFDFLFINGRGPLHVSPVAGEFDGLDSMVALGYGQSIAASSTLADFDNAMAELKSDDRNVGDLVWIMHSDAWKQVLGLARAASSDPSITFDYCPDLGYRTMHIHGAPVCICDHVPSTTSTNIYLASRRQVVILVNRSQPDVVFTDVQSAAVNAKTYLGAWRAAMASFTDLGLIRITGF